MFWFSGAVGWGRSKNTTLSIIQETSPLCCKSVHPTVSIRQIGLTKYDQGYFWGKAWFFHVNFCFWRRNTSNIRKSHNYYIILSIWDRILWNVQISGIPFSISSIRQISFRKLVENSETFKNDRYNFFRIPQRSS